MSLVHLVDPDDAAPEALPMLESGMAQYGMALAAWRALLNRPPIFATYLPYLRAVAGPGVVDQRVKDLAALQVALLNHCRYTTSHRVRAARASGAAEADLAALAAGRLDALTDAEQAAIAYATELTLRPPAVDYATNPQAIDPAVLARVRATFSDPELVELTANICLWNALTRFHRVMAFELDMDPPPAVLDEVL